MWQSWYEIRSPRRLASRADGEAESSVGMAYMNRINNEFVKTGSRGITLLFATGA